MNKDGQKRYLSDYTKEELSKLSVDQVQQLFMETLKEIVEVSESATRHINQLDEYRKKFSAAFQDYKMFSVSLAENILMKECKAEQEQSVKDTLIQMGRNDLAVDTQRILGREYDTEGLVPSGGQQQWIAVARLHFDTFEIAVLDEPSAALDPISARQMQEEMFHLVNNRSMLMVSHDMSVTKYADRILFLDMGELVAQGTHGELMQQNQKYMMFYECQAKSFRENMR